MKHKSLLQNLLVAFAVFTVVATGITVLVLAASNDDVLPESAPPASSPIEEGTSSDIPGITETLTLSVPETSEAEIRLEYTDEFLPFETVYIEDASMKKGTSVTETRGQKGLSRTAVEVILHDGVEVSRQVAGTRIIREPVSEVIRVGTYVMPPATVVSTHNNSSGTMTSYNYSRNFLESVSIDEVNKTITTPSGEVFYYSSSFIGEATAYSCEGNPNAITATGTKARVGEVAVDPKFIPLGTKMFIVLSDGSLIYGYCVAEDTGGAVKGNIVDLFFDTLAECYAFGRRNCTVYVLG